MDKINHLIGFIIEDVKYNREEFYYLGVGNPKREIIPNFFKGYIDGFAQWDKVLTERDFLDR